MHASKEIKRLASRFSHRAIAALGLGNGRGQDFHVFENPTEELVDGIERHRAPRLYGVDRPGVVGRVEENYLFYTRRFPLNTVNNTIGAGAIAAQDYLFFANGVGDQGSAAGYFSVANLTYTQTNMASGGKIPTGRGYRMFDIGISFNTGAKVGDIEQMLDAGNLRFEKQASQLVLQHGKLSMWPGGLGVYAATTATATTAAANGFPALTNVRRMRNPRVLNANDQFNYILNIPSANLPKDNSAIALSDFVEISIWLFGQQIDGIAN